MSTIPPARCAVAFDHLAEDVHRNVFKYLTTFDRIKFERVHSRVKFVLRDSTTKIDDVRSFSVVDKERLYGEHVHEVIFKYPNLQTVNFSVPDSVEYAKQLANCCPNLVYWKGHSLVQFVEYSMALKVVGEQCSLKRLEVALTNHSPFNFVRLLLAVQNCSQLTELDLAFRGPQVTKMGQDNVQELIKAIAPTIKVLKIENDDENFVELFKNVEALTIDKPVDFSNFPKLTSLTIDPLTKDYNNVLDSVRGLKNLKLVTKVDVQNGNNHSLIKKLLANNSTTLTTLDLIGRDNDVTIITVASKIPSLVRLRHLCNCWSSIDGVNYAMPFFNDALPQLRSLSFGWLRFEHINELNKLLNPNRRHKLRFIELSWSKFKLRQTRMVARQLAKDYPKRRITLRIVHCYKEKVEQLENVTIEFAYDFKGRY